MTIGLLVRMTLHFFPAFTYTSHRLSNPRGAKMFSNHTQDEILLSFKTAYCYRISEMIIMLLVTMEVPQKTFFLISFPA